MADTKITALAAITTVDPAADVLPIVDISDTSMAASGTTKKITSNQILGAGGTATLASATITGAATVGTTLGVTGVSTFAAGTALLPALTTTGDVNTGIYYPAADTFAVTTGGTERYRVDSSGNVGVGVTPTAKLDVNGTVIIRDTFSLLMGFGNQQRILAGGGSDNTFLTFSQWTGAAYTERMRIDQSGNVGVGITPSAWATSTTIWRALDMQYSCGLASSGAGSGEIDLLWNAYYDQTDQRWEFKYTGDRASRYSIGGAGVHTWYNTASTGTANNPITWNPAMTLDASGNLLVGKTATNYLTVGCEIKPLGAFNCTQSGSTNANTAWDTYSTGASAYRFYVGMGGTVYATNTTISAISDARLKENVEDIDVGLSAILALKPRKFDWKAGKGKDIKGDRGFIAQEFEQVFPQLVDEWKDNTSEGEAPYKSVRQDLIPVLVKAIQELAAEVNALKNA